MPFDKAGVDSLSRAALENKKVRLKPLPPPKKGEGGITTMPTKNSRQGRPKEGTVRRETMPSEDKRIRKDGSSAGWEGLSGVLRRPDLPLYSFENLKWTEADLLRALRIMSKISPDVAMAKHLVKRLSNTGIVVSVKSVNEDGSSDITVEDPEATRRAREMMEKAGQQVVSDFPGAMGGLSTFIDSLIDYGFTDGAMAAELTPNAALDDIDGMFAFDPLTVELRRDPDNPGFWLIGQKRWDAKLGWKQLNPNLTCYQPLTGQEYGESEMLTALHMIPMWMGFFGKLQIFLHRAAFGFMDGVVKIEVLQEMWKQVSAEVRSSYDDDFMTWAQAMVDFLAASYKDQEEADPDALLAHLDLLEIKGEASGKAAFPISDTQKLLKQEVYASLRTPGEMLGGEATSNDKFTAMKIEAYHAYLKFIQGKVLEIVNRFILIGLTIQGYDKKVKPDCTFNPIPIDDRLTTAQALQLEQLCARFLRDENIVSQNAMSRMLIGKPAVGPAPLAKDGASQDGPSAPDPEKVNPKPDPNPSAGGPSFGGKKQGASDRAPNQEKDKKV